MPWPQLPNFFQEDNVRQYWQILSWFGRNGYRWEWTDSSEEVARVVSDYPMLRQVAADEYARWQSTRMAAGWLSGQRHDPYRLYPNLTNTWAELDAGSLEYNIHLTRMVIRRMAATGLVPVKVGQDVSG